MNTDHYATLGISSDASQDEVARRYRDLVRMYHPDLARDKANATEKLISINLAYFVLRDGDRRRAYDTGLWKVEAQAPSDQPTVVYSSGESRATRPREESKPAQVAVQPAPTVRQPQSRPETHTAESSIFTNVCCEHNRPGPLDHPGLPPIKCYAICPLNRAEAEFKHGRFQSAVGLCREHIALHADSRKALELLGDVYAHDFDVENAITAYLAALHLAPRETRLRAKLQMLRASAQFNEDEAGHDAITHDHVEPPKPHPAPVVIKPRSILGSIADAIGSLFGSSE